MQLFQLHLSLLRYPIPALLQPRDTGGMQTIQDRSGGVEVLEHQTVAGRMNELTDYLSALGRCFPTENKSLRDQKGREERADDNLRTISVPTHAPHRSKRVAM